MTAWTGDELSLASRLWREGKSSTEIAMTLGNRSRNSVVSAMHRLKVPTPASPNASGFPNYKTKTTTVWPGLTPAQIADARVKRLSENAKKRWADPVWPQAQRARISSGLLASPHIGGSNNARWDRHMIKDHMHDRPEPWHPARDKKPEWLLKGVAR